MNQERASTKHFTFYGDLVGIASLYNATPAGAYDALNAYYNTVFFGLQSYFKDHLNRKVEMFSDSLVVTGDDPQAFIVSMAPVYANLVQKGLLLRGGMVTGALQFDVRVTTGNFEKALPTTDVLARAASLERKVKGARFLVDSALTHDLIGACPQWLTLHGYISDPKPGDTDVVLQRSLVPIPDGSAYEVLYPVLELPEDQIIEKRIGEMDMTKVLPPELAQHYTDTRRLYEHSRVRVRHHREQSS
jgi:hypothetical protein